MARLLFGLGIVVVIFTVYAIVDCAMFDRSRIRGIGRVWWILVILLVPVIGGVLWFLVGRGRKGRPPRRAQRTVAPDDDADFLRGLDRDAAQEERIRRLEEELADLDDRTDQPDLPTDHPDHPEHSERRRDDDGDTPPSSRPNA
ncbi:hypothetical protein ARHIZOSPH14_11020 [Agromyces rhizosphaerae]|uniref:Cardiolipin synthase N-terminal domain-containing protein n=1 Tax=Agromyces rhizosphaerae TaxID=88374 RepID=A0A9W6CUZ3_9MICO|nr:PLD nuclease N-terminal domain-containing protein [Agromyces rhizosphaerae]GLI26860.1 hypothetical protein ARHIZOSPH14_11020 [Agromyces rhizosphaerae]